MDEFLCTAMLEDRAFPASRGKNGEEGRNGGETVTMLDKETVEREAERKEEGTGQAEFGDLPIPRVVMDGVGK